MKKRELVVFLVLATLLALVPFVTSNKLGESGTFFDDFESGDLDTYNWTTSGAGSAWFISTDDPYADSNLIEADSTSGESIIETAVNTTSYLNITFSFYYDTDGLDSGEYFAADWYNGTGWTNVLNLEDTAGWTLYDSGFLPSAAENNSNFKIRFRCSSGSTGEECKVDNVRVNGTTTDTTPSNSVTNLNSPFNGTTWVYWNWTNPSSDFYQAIVYLDGIWKTNTSNNFYNATGLTVNTNYTITVHTKDLVGNVNGTDVNHTAAPKDPIFPVIRAVSDDPDPVAPGSNITITLNVSDNLDVDSAWVEINGTNYTMTRLLNDEGGEPAGIFYDDFNRYSAAGQSVGNGWVENPLLGWSSTDTDNDCFIDASLDCVMSTASTNNITISASTKDRVKVIINTHARCTGHDAGVDYLKIAAYDGTAWATVYDSNVNGGCLATSGGGPLPEINLSASYSNLADFKLRYSCRLDGGNEECVVDNVNITGRPAESDIWELNFNTTGQTGLINYTAYTNDTSNNVVSIKSNYTMLSPPTINYALPIPSSPIEDESMYLYANVTDINDNTIIWVNFTIKAPNGTIIVNNQNASSNSGDIWNSTTFIASSIGTWTWNITAKDDNSSEYSTASGTFRVSSWQTIKGNVTGRWDLHTSTGSTLVKWSDVNTTGSNIYVVDTDSTISFSDLIAFSRDTSGSYHSDDFEEIDYVLNRTNFEDSVNITYTTNSNPKSTDTFYVFDKIINNVPVTNASSATDFVTGILWDSSDDDDGQYDSTDKEDIVFVTKVNTSLRGQYGYDYALSVIADLKKYKTPDTDTVSIYTEIK